MSHHTAVKLAKSEIQRILDILAVAPGFDENDEQLKLDMLEGETEMNEIVSRLLAENEDDAGRVAALKQQMDDRRDRKSRFELRIEARRKAIASLMDCARLTNLPLPEATVSVRTLKPKPVVTDEDKLPEKFVTTETVKYPNLEAIKEAIERGETIPGVTISNGGASLTVRRK